VPSQVPGVPGSYQYPSYKRYFQVSFDYEFTHAFDTVTFAYSVPYSLSKLVRELRTLTSTHTEEHSP
jgi:hypothetical protein